MWLEEGTATRGGEATPGRVINLSFMLQKRYLNYIIITATAYHSVSNSKQEEGYGLEWFYSGWLFSSTRYI